MKVGIIGCGLIGKKRAFALDEDDILIACCDTNEEIGKQFALDFNCQYYKNYIDLIRNTDCDAIIISVVNKYIEEISIEALKYNKHILVEKPFGRNSKESKNIIDSSNGKVIKVGFNHRFHPSILKAKSIVDSGYIGDIIVIRGYYGHGSRHGMENEWRSSKELCGGGELLDQGVHLIDLSRWFAGEMKDIYGKIKTKFWNIEVEDNAFILMESFNNVDIQLHVSWTNWKNVFSFEIFGTDGYLKISGLGGSYGKETLEFGLRKIGGGLPIIENFEYPMIDVSWSREWNEFKSAIQENREPIGNGFDGLKANEIIDAIYKINNIE